MKESLHELNSTIKEVGFSEAGLANRVHNRKKKRYKTAVVEFLRNRKSKHACHKTFRRKLKKLDANFLTCVLSEMVNDGVLVKNASKFSLANHDDV